MVVFLFNDAKIRSFFGTTKCFGEKKCEKVENSWKKLQKVIFLFKNSSYSPRTTAVFSLFVFNTFHLKPYVYLALFQFFAAAVANVAVLYVQWKQNFLTLLVILLALGIILS